MTNSLTIVQNTFMLSQNTHTQTQKADSDEELDSDIDTNTTNKEEESKFKFSLDCNGVILVSSMFALFVYVFFFIYE